MDKALKLYGSWQHSLTIGEQTFRADRIEESRAKRAGFDTVYAIDGLPPLFEDDLVRGAQVCSVPHTWCVKEVSSEDEVSDEVLKLGREVLRNDQKEFNATIFSYVGQNNEALGSYYLLAAGAIRNKLTKRYLSNEFPVVSRAVVLPKYRGKGLGTVMVQHRMAATLSYFGEAPKAIHFATESKEILSAIKHTEQILGASFTHIGNEVYETNTGTHTVTDYLCFLPNYREQLTEAAETLENNIQSPKGLKEHLMRFINEGVSQASGTQLEKLFLQTLGALSEEKKNLPEVIGAMSLLFQFFEVRKTIGAADPTEPEISRGKRD